MRNKPFTRVNDPYTGVNEPYTPENKPFTRVNDLFTRRNKPLTGVNEPYTGVNEPFTGVNEPDTGSRDLFLIEKKLLTVEYCNDAHRPRNASRVMSSIQFVPGGPKASNPATCGQLEQATVLYRSRDVVMQYLPGMR